MMKQKINILLIFIFCCTFAFAQNERKDIETGSKFYKKNEYEKAETAYREALLKNKNSIEANFNLGNALYRQGKFDLAKDQFQIIAETATDKKTAAAAYHNLGNTYMSKEEYENSVAAYKKSLRLNPKDDDTRYNLALANALLKKQQQQPKQNQQQQEQEQEKQQPQSPQPQENNISKESAQQILDAFLQDEKDVLDKINKQNQSNKRQLDKDW